MIVSVLFIVALVAILATVRAHRRAPESSVWSTIVVCVAIAGAACGTAVLVLRGF